MPTALTSKKPGRWHDEDGEGDGGGDGGVEMSHHRVVNPLTGASAHRRNDSAESYDEGDGDEGEGEGEGDEEEGNGQPVTVYEFGVLERGIRCSHVLQVDLTEVIDRSCPTVVLTELKRANDDARDQATGCGGMCYGFFLLLGCALIPGFAVTGAIGLMGRTLPVGVCAAMIVAGLLAPLPLHMLLYQWEDAHADRHRETMKRLMGRLATGPCHTATMAMVPPRVAVLVPGEGRAPLQMNCTDRSDMWREAPALRITWVPPGAGVEAALYHAEGMWLTADIVFRATRRLLLVGFIPLGISMLWYAYTRRKRMERLIAEHEAAAPRQAR